MRCKASLFICCNTFISFFSPGGLNVLPYDLHRLHLFCLSIDFLLSIVLGFIFTSYIRCKCSIVEEVGGWPWIIRAHYLSRCQTQNNQLSHTLIPMSVCVTVAREETDKIWNVATVWRAHEKAGDPVLTFLSAEWMRVDEKADSLNHTLLHCCFFFQLYISMEMDDHLWRLNVMSRSVHVHCHSVQ